MMRKRIKTKWFFYLLWIFCLPIRGGLAQQQIQSISPKFEQRVEAPLYSKHWLDRLPLSKKPNPLLIHDLFVISFHLEKRFPSWIAYQLSPHFVWGSLKAERKYVPDPLLPLKGSFRFKNYKGASNCDGKHPGYDKGHLAPLGSFKGSPYIYQAQYLSNIVPQKRNLNQGPWKKLEELVKSFVKKGNIAHILTGPLYGREGVDKVAPCWKAAQGLITEVPISYWKVITFKQKSKIKVCSVLMPQNISRRNDPPKKYQVKLEDIEKKTGLILFTDRRKSTLSDCRFLFGS